MGKRTAESLEKRHMQRYGSLVFWVVLVGAFLLIRVVLPACGICSFG